MRKSVDEEIMDRELVNKPLLEEALEREGVDVLIAVTPESTHYLSSVFIRTQVTIRARLAFVIWPRDDLPTFLVCHIEESLARSAGSIDDVETYEEFSQDPVQALCQLLISNGYQAGRLGIETEYLNARQLSLMQSSLPKATIIPFDSELEMVRAVKTEAEILAIQQSYHLTEEAIATAWSRSRVKDTERDIANHMSQTLLEFGCEGIRHLTLTSGRNTIHPHMVPSERRVETGDIVLTDVGGFLRGFGSDMARMGVMGTPSNMNASEYRKYQRAYVETVNSLRPGQTGREVFSAFNARWAKDGLYMPFNHVGHGVGRRAAHESPLLHLNSDVSLVPGMVLAIEPSYIGESGIRYHLEDLVLVGEDDIEILTDIDSTQEMLPLGEAS